MDPAYTRSTLRRDGAPLEGEGQGRGQGQVGLGPYLLRVIWVLGGLSTVLLGLRIFSKLWRRRPLWWDDYVLIAAWVSLRPLPAFPLFSFLFPFFSFLLFPFPFLSFFFFISFSVPVTVSSGSDRLTNYSSPSSYPSPCRPLQSAMASASTTAPSIPTSSSP